MCFACNEKAEAVKDENTETVKDDNTTQVLKIKSMQGLMTKVFDDPFKGMEGMNGSITAYFRNDTLHKLEKSIVTGEKAQFNTYYYWKSELISIYQQEYTGNAPKLPLQYDKIINTHTFNYHFRAGSLIKATEEGPDFFNNQERLNNLGKQLYSESGILKALATGGRPTR